MSVLISTGQLEQELRDNPALKILDATAYLPTEAADAQALFCKQHIPGARFFDIEAFSDPDSDLPHMLSTAGRFGRLVGAFGISNDADIVVYDQKGLFSAARVWWTFGVFGHDRIRVLDGGLPKWVAEQRPVEAGDGAVWTPLTFRAGLRSDRVKGVDDVAAASASRSALILDARSEERFTGNAAEPRAGLRSGHIPGSRSLPFGRLLNEDKTLKPAADIRQIAAAAGYAEGTPVITSCGSGMTAAIVSLGLRHAGLAEGALYDGSWTEWGARQDLPIAVDDVG